MDDLTVGWVGRLDPTKRLEDAIAAFAMLRDQAPRAKLRIAAGADSFGSVSAREYRAQVRRLVKSLGLADRMDFQEEVADVYRFLDDIDVFVNSSERETFSRSTYEAMLMGRPIVSTRAAAVTDLISEGHNGLIVDVGDVSGLAASLLALQQDRERAARLGEAARSDALTMAERYDADARLDELYMEVITNPSSQIAG